MLGSHSWVQFNPLPMASHFLRVKKTHRKRTTRSFLSTFAIICPYCTSEFSPTDKVQLCKIHPSQDMATVTSNTVQIQILMFKGTSIIPPCHIYGSVGLPRKYLHCQHPGQGLVLRMGTIQISEKPGKTQSGAQVIPEVTRISNRVVATGCN